MPIPDEVELTDPEQLRALLGEPLRQVAEKARPALHPHDRDWLAASPFCVLATADAMGNLDVSPKGDPPGFVRVLDDRTIAIPDRPGNRRADGFHNILANPHVGLLSLIPGRGDTLRINGRARLCTDAPYFDQMLVRGHRPAIVMVVEIDEVFYHCPKALMRSKLWDADTARVADVPSRAQISHTLERREQTIEELEAHYGPSYADALYRS